MNKFLEIFALEKSFTKEGGMVRIVRDSPSLREGEFVSLIGHSGCGKSTVLSMVAGLTSIDDGGVVLAGRAHGPGPIAGWCSSRPACSRGSTCSATWHWRVLRAPARQPRAAARTGRALPRDGRPRDSLGQGCASCLRHAAARRHRPGVALEPKMLLLDEPFGMLDSITRAELQEVLAQLCAETARPR